jgi:hypothetical protein
LLVAFSAVAGGRVVWKKTKIDEVDGKWKLEMEVHLDKAPDVAWVPVTISFEQTVYYEQTLMDGKSEPVLTKQPLINQAPKVEQAEIGFSDPTTGKTQKRTRFTLPVTRDSEYEAGEYKVTVEEKSTGKKLGTPQTIILEGKNKPIDRRAIIVEERKKEKKKAADSDEPAAANPDSAEYWAGGPTEPESKQADLPPPASMRERPCGCRVPGSSQGPDRFAYFGLAFLGAVWLLRRVK